MGILRKFLSSLMLVPLCFFATQSFAQILPPPLLNKVAYQLTVEKWATTTTADVTVSIDAILDKIGLDKINEYVLKNMQILSTGSDWHIVQYTRSQDKSGLEMMHIEVQARVAGKDLAQLRDKAKAISKPGETYTVTSIDFSPSKAETEKTQADVRTAIYDLVKQEIARLNQIYPDQHYFLYSLSFGVQGVPGVGPGRMAYGGNVGMVMAEAAPKAEFAAPPMPVNAKIVQMADVTIASIVHAPGATPAS